MEIIKGYVVKMKIRVVMCCCVLLILLMTGCNNRKSPEDANDEKTHTDNSISIEKELNNVIFGTVSSKKLAQEVVTSPYLIEVFVSSVCPVNTDILIENSDAYKELIKRKDGKDVLIEEIKELEEKGEDQTLIMMLKEIILHEKAFENILTEDELKYLKDE